MNQDRTNKLLELKNLVESDSIDYELVLKIVSDLQLPHKTKEWKEKRESIIKDHCEICGKKETNLVLQHTKHPKKFEVIKKELIKNELIKDKEIYEKYKSIAVESYIEYYLNKYYHLTNTCPNCNSMKIKSRAFKKPTYKCLECKLEFEEPQKVEYYNGIGLRVLGRKKANEILIKRYQNTENKSLIEKYYYYNVNNPDIDKKAIVENLRQSIEYLKMTHTITACKRCAFKEDREMIEQKTAHNSG